MVRYLMRVGYIGTKYRGTQRMPGIHNETIQDIIESSLSTLKLKNVPKTYFASRTDKGVHALMNAFHVDLEHNVSGEVYYSHYLKRKLNSYLIDNNHEILVSNVCVVPDIFHARRNAKWRSYCYRVAVLKKGLTVPIKSNYHHGYLPTSEINRCILVSSELNTDIVKRVTDLYYGKHDFTIFTKYLIRDPWRNPVRVIDECQFYETSYNGCISDPQYENISMWEFYIQSSAFLYHQVRKLVSTALFAGFGLLSLEEVKCMLDNPEPGLYKCRLAPACGLYLANIHYDESDFQINESSGMKEEAEAKCDLL